MPTDLPKNDDPVSERDGTLHERVTAWIGAIFVGCLLIAVLLFGGHSNSTRTDMSSPSQATTGTGR